jgi:predicted acylesterase/phospholipase RssA
VALVCAGGGVTGAVYEIGCLRALEDLLDRSVLDLDLYVGVSGGAFVASLLAHGVSPREMYAEATGSSPKPLGISRTPLFRLGLSEFLGQSLKAPRVLRNALLAALEGEGGRLADFGFGLLEMLPPGLLSNSGIQEYLEELFRSRGGTDRFADLARKLYIVAVDLDNAAHVAFGERGHRDVPISKAVQASTALPGLYRPVRIGKRDFVDGGVKKTAHINLAISHGADLVICLNPLVPLLNRTEASELGHLSSRGIAYVLEQVLRIVVYGRMHYGLERYEIEHPEVDILLLEPRREDLAMFGYNIMRYGARRVVARDGYRSVLREVRRHRGRYTRLLARHGIALRDPRLLRDLPEESRRAPVSLSLERSLEELEGLRARGG